MRVHGCHAVELKQSILHSRRAACARINLSFRDVCRMPVHKFRGKLHSAERTTVLLDRGSASLFLRRVRVPFASLFDSSQFPILPHDFPFTRASLSTRVRFRKIVSAEALGRGARGPVESSRCIAITPLQRRRVQRG